MYNNEENEIQLSKYNSKKINEIYNLFNDNKDLPTQAQFNENVR